MNSDISSVNQRIFDLEKTVRDLKTAVNSFQSSTPRTIVEHKRKYPKWWPFDDISPAWFMLLVLWPFITRRLGIMLTNRQRK